MLSQNVNLFIFRLLSLIWKKIKNNIIKYSITFYKSYLCSSACDCNENGALGDLLCNTGDGQCNCKDNFGGRQCDECKDGFYQYPYCYSE